MINWRIIYRVIHKNCLVQDETVLTSIFLSVRNLGLDFECDYIVAVNVAG